jgi:hypothetical protein
MITKLDSYIDNNNFYLVVNLEKTYNDIINGYFTNLPGISNSKYIIKSYFDIRNTLIVMNYNDTIKLNKLQEIKYDDIDQLVKFNFKILKRLTTDHNNTLLFNKFSRIFERYNSNKNTDYYKELNDVFLKLKIKKSIQQELYNKYSKFFDRNSYNFAKLYTENTPTILNFNDFCNWFLSNLNNIPKETTHNIPYGNTPYNINDFDNNMWILFLKVVLLATANAFTKEKEFIVESKKFIIPTNSIIYFKFNDFSNLDDDIILFNRKNLGNTYSKNFYLKFINDNNLDAKYKFKFVKSHEELL